MAFHHQGIVGCDELTRNSGKTQNLPRDRIGIGHVIAVHTQYGMEQSQRRASMKKFAEEVIPHFR